MTTGDGDRREAAVTALAILLARRRFGHGVSMSGAHNPTPGETTIARQFIDDWLALSAPPEPPEQATGDDEPGRCTDLTKYPKGWLRCPLPAGHDGMHEIDFDNPGTAPVSPQRSTGCERCGCTLSQHLGGHGCACGCGGFVTPQRSTEQEGRAECSCYPGGFSPGTYEGPQEWCEVHGEWRSALIEQRAAALARAEAAEGEAARLNERLTLLHADLDRKRGLIEAYKGGEEQALSDLADAQRVIAAVEALCDKADAGEFERWNRVPTDDLRAALAASAPSAGEETTQ